MKSWLSKTVKGRQIERIPCPYINQPVTGVPTGVLHTTEGGWNSAMSVFRQHYAPHFLVGVGGRIAQLVPLGKMASALEHPAGFPETNRVCHQIEVEGRSKTVPYQFPLPQFEALADLLATLKVEAGIPLMRYFPDVMPPLPWATRSFVRRQKGYWGRRPGWYGHVDVPGNSHWDPGYYKWRELLAQAEKFLPVAEPSGFSVIFRRADGSIFATKKARWPRTAIVGTDIVKNKITRIDVKPLG